MKTRNLKLTALLGAAALAVSFSGPAAAVTNTATLPVTASVAASCSISTTAVAFGAYDPIVANAAAGSDLNQGTNGTIVVNCLAGSTSVSIGLNNGGNYSGGVRNMVGGVSGGLLAYHLYLPSATTPSAACTFPGTTEWGTTIGTDTLDPADGTWDGTDKTFYVCGTVPKGQSPAADSYTDSVTASVNF